MSTLTLTLNGKSSHLYAEYFPPIDISDGDYVCGLIDFQTFNAVPNVDETNNLFHFHYKVKKEIREKQKNKDGSAQFSDVQKSLIGALGNDAIVLDENVEIRSECITIPVGSYEITQIAKYLGEQLLKHGLIFHLQPNKNTLECEMTCSAWMVDFSKENSIGSLLGFNRKLYVEHVMHVSEATVKITRVNAVRIDCDLIKGSYINNQPAHTIHEFSIKVEPGYKIIEVPNKVIYFPIVVKSISSVNISLIDQENKLIDFRGETITLRIHIKRVK